MLFTVKGGKHHSPATVCSGSDKGRARAEEWRKGHKMARLQCKKSYPIVEGSYNDDAIGPCFTVIILAGHPRQAKAAAPHDHLHGLL